MTARLESQADGWRHYRIDSGLFGYTASYCEETGEWAIWSRATASRVNRWDDIGREIVLACASALAAVRREVAA